MGRPTWRLLAALMTSMLAACVPSTPFDAVALRQVAPSTIELLWTPCAPAKIQSVEIIAPSDAVFDDEDPRLWKIVFEPPTDQHEFVLGEAPPSSSVVVPWQGLSSNERFVALLTTEQGQREYQGAELSDLADGRVRFHDKTLTLEEYEKQSACK